MKEVVFRNAFKGKWQSVGYMGLLGSFGIMAYYMVLGGFVLVYIFSLLFGDFNLSSAVSKEYTQILHANILFNPLGIGIFTTILYNKLPSFKAWDYRWD